MSEHLKLVKENAYMKLCIIQLIEELKDDGEAKVIKDYLVDVIDGVYGNTLGDNKENYFDKCMELVDKYKLPIHMHFCENTQEIEDIIIKKNISDTIKNLKMKQGVKNKDKWSWIVSDSLDKTDKELVDWFVKTITQFYNSFEENVCKIIEYNQNINNLHEYYRGNYLTLYRKIRYHHYNIYYIQ